MKLVQLRAGILSFGEHTVLQPLAAYVKPSTKRGHAICFRNRLTIEPFADGLSRLINTNHLQMLVNVHAPAPASNAGVVKGFM